MTLRIKVCSALAIFPHSLVAELLQRPQRATTSRLGRVCEKSEMIISIRFFLRLPLQFAKPAPYKGYALLGLNSVTVLVSGTE